MSATPGPWRTDPEFQQVWDKDGRQRVADCDHKQGLHRPPRPERWANMLLIAAAPDLLAACAAMVATLDVSDRDELVWRRSDAWDLLHAAIAKAEGK